MANEFGHGASSERDRADGTAEYPRIGIGVAHVLSPPMLAFVCPLMFRSPYHSASRELEASSRPRRLLHARGRRPRERVAEWTVHARPSRRSRAARPNRWP